MLVQLIFASTAVDRSPATIERILTRGRQHNQERGITGLLCHGWGMYLQVMEGGRQAVNQTFAEVLHDAGHSDVQLIYFSEVAERNFANWDLGQIRLEKISTASLLKFMERLPFSPAQLNGVSARAMLLELVAKASVEHH